MDKYRKAFYRQVLNLSLEMRIQLPYEEVLNMASIDEYNNFNVDRLKLILDKIDSLIPTTYYNENNPNNGRRLYTLSIGREGSMVVYLNLSGFSISDGSREAIKIIREKVQELEIYAREKALVDEFSIDYNSNEYGEELELRLWWD